MDSTSYAAAVAANVDQAIKAAGLSVLKLAQATGIPRTTLDRRLRSNGFSPFSVAELKAIADEVGTTASVLATVYAADPLARPTAKSRPADEPEAPAVPAGHRGEGAA